MRRLLSLTAVTACALVGAAPAAAETAHTRIVHGSATTIDQYPYQAYVQIEASTGGYFQCGGVILDSTHVVTAAHCVTDEDTLLPVNPTYVLVGSGATGVADLDVVDVSEVESAAQYSGEPSNDYDIARLTLAQPLQGYGGNNVDSIPIASAATLNAGIGAGNSATATGWGATSEGGRGSASLRKVDLKLRSDGDCSAKYVEYVGARDVCAGGTGTSVLGGNADTCQGDSGGPLALNGQLVGLTSYGNGCGRASTPGIYADPTQAEMRAIAEGTAPSTATLRGSAQPLYGAPSKTTGSVTPVATPAATVIAPKAVAPRDATRPTLAYWKQSCTKRHRCTFRLRAGDNSGAVKSLAASVARKARTCTRKHGRKRCRTVTRRTRLKVTRSSGGFVATGTLVPARYALTAYATDPTGNRSKTLTKNVRVPR